MNLVTAVNAALKYNATCITLPEFRGSMKVRVSKDRPCVLLNWDDTRPNKNKPGWNPTGGQLMREDWELVRET